MASSNSLRKYLLPLQRARQRLKQPHHRRESESPALLTNMSSQIIQISQYVHGSIVALSKALHVENAWLCTSFITNANFVQFIVMFRSRFTDAFPKSLPNFGPQELERDVVDVVPGEHAEQFLCALLGLLLNRKQDVK
jgi:hypothetical protein